MAAAHRGAEAVAVFATVLALAACGAEVEDDPSLTVGPTLPSQDATSAPEEDRRDASDPTVTPPEAQTAAQSPSSPPPTAETTQPSQTTPDTGPPADGSTSTTEALPAFQPPGQERSQPAGEQAHLVAQGVRLGVHAGFDRVVLDLSGAPGVGWRAGYLSQPALAGSGLPVDLAGTAVLQITALGLAAPGSEVTAYQDGTVLTDGGPLQQVTEVLQGTPFEGQLQLFIGTTQQVPYRVWRLSDPERLVIDLQHRLEPGG